ncbi:MAG: calcium-binding protein [Alphaproteobacteria bacterium]|nr:calcium-binding protein [Alphaproteobacteria bacterium]
MFRQPPRPVGPAWHEVSGSSRIAIGDSNSFLNADWDPSFALSMGVDDEFARRLRAADDLVGSHGSALSAAYAAIVASGETWMAPSVGRSVAAGDGDDVVIGSSGDDHIDGGAGADALVGGAGADTLMGGDGNDVMFGATIGIVSASNPHFDIFNKPNVMYGGNDDDLMVGGPSNDAMYGEAGNDVIMGMQGSDAISGGGGDNVIYGDYGSSAMNDPYSLILNNPAGLTFDDYIEAGDCADLVFGGVGDDEVHGGTGNDRIFGGVGRDTVHGGAGDDVIYGDYSTASGAPAGGWDKLVPGWMFDDHLYGDAGNYALFGGIGNDVLSGGARRDLLFGGAGDDTYVFARGDGTDQIRDMGFAGDRNTLQLHGSGGDDGVEASEVTFVNNGGGNWTLAFNDGSGSISFSSADIDSVSLYGAGDAEMTTYAWDDAQNAYGAVG